VANNGREAVDTLLQSKAGEFDVVLMDVQMPVLDGLAATQEIRRAEAKTGRHIAIVAMTANAMKNDRQRCINAGMDDYVSKPFQPQELFTAIEQVIDSQHTSAIHDTAMSDLSADVRVTSPTVADVQVSDLADEETFPYDRKIALLSVDGDEEMLSEMASLFIQECPQQMEQITRAHANSDMRALSRAAHTMKGSAALFGAEHVRSMAYRIEEMGAGNYLSGYEEAWHSLKKEIERLLAALKQLCK
jgi:CheY-like chemotaxis protein